MTFLEIRDAVKDKFWFMDLASTTLGFNDAYYNRRLTEAFRKLTLNSGKTKWARKVTSGYEIVFTAGEGVYVPVSVYHRDSSAAARDAEFSIWQNNLLFHPAYSNGLMYHDFQHLIIGKGFLSALHQHMGVIMDFHWERDIRTLYINSKLTYESLIINYLPIWSLGSDEEECNDLFVCDWIIDYTVALVQLDFYRILSSGGAFNLPSDFPSFEDLKETLKEFESTLRARYPLIGMSKG